ncbi:thiamine pyrophosphate-dependent dehydrogenase E1 component subunit alpha [Aliiglaciecola sp. LCG003]|uniref:thiamine pyrophosphate-dependent dehydrogenase E1 component subunit alpha n=1 Tax=Aliiglaciecola sp. LCG003 TaxID=3053655 RepID=UPI00257482B2|nr:thiamine pyrophosphate-dependent dehydrogenase E1 component subunit alpha [Aliiglaciecola sp. LCG003]WJG10589.1 thiamine pyrophosphate-dependent dehydrogenase E1 component subunit alpha [Aliiglaciecola sp. LCG003]
MSLLLSYYQDILRIRLVEEAIAARYSEQKMRCPTHLSIGQEAVAVGVSASLSHKDKAYSSHRAHAHYLAKGGDLKKLIAELYGKETGCTGGRGGSMHLTDLDAGFVASTAIVGNSIPLAVGNALHQQVQKLDEISVAYFGEGATEEGAFYESANFAALKGLPILFVCENNGYSVYSPLHVRQPKGRSITKLAEAIGVQAVEVDGNDVIQVADVAAKNIDNIRSGAGPVLMECHTYRHREHCGPNWDDDLAYRPSWEVSKWLERDPVNLLESQLLRENPANDKAIVLAKQTIQMEINQAFDFAEDSRFPTAQHNSRFVYA